MHNSAVREGWETYRFEEMAILVNERVDDPSQAGVDRYVGLEHLDADSLKIRRWGSNTDVAAQKLRFWSGDIIFGKRRVYQRKLGVADFNGICSAHAMVLRARSGVALPEFLPFFMQSDLFMDRALRISVGSLSPTINWGTLANEEFDLPPLKEQRRVAGALWAVEELLSALRTADTRARSLSDSLFAAITGSNAKDQTSRGSSWPETNLGSVVFETQYGLSNAPSQTGRYPILRMSNLANNRAIEEDLKYVDLSDAEFETYRLRLGDVLFNRTNSHDLVGRTGVYTLSGDHVFASYLVRIKTDPGRLNPHFLSVFLNSSAGRNRVMEFATRGVSQTNVNASNLRKLRIPLPPTPVQGTLMARLATVDTVRRDFEKRASTLGSLADVLAPDSFGRQT